MEIPVNLYWKNSRTFSAEEERLRQKLCAWLANIIFDSPAHCCRPDHLFFRTEYVFSRSLSTFPYHDLANSRQMQAVFYPGKEVRTLRFGYAVEGYDFIAQNKYLAKYSVASDGMVLLGVPSDLNYTLQAM